MSDLGGGELAHDELRRAVVGVRLRHALDDLAVARRVQVALDYLAAAAAATFDCACVVHGFCQVDDLVFVILFMFIVSIAARIEVHERALVVRTRLHLEEHLVALAGVAFGRVVVGGGGGGGWDTRLVGHAVQEELGLGGRLTLDVGELLRLAQSALALVYHRLHRLLLVRCSLAGVVAIDGRVWSKN